MKNKSKINIKLLVGIAAAVILLGIGALIWVFAGGEGQQTAPAEKLELYWNVHRRLYLEEQTTVIGGTSRKQDKDGYYHVLFAHDGEQITLQVAEEALMERIDQLDVMGLVLDDEGVVTDVKSVQQLGGQILSEYYYVAEITDVEIVTDSSSLYNGVKEFLNIEPDTRIYDVSGISGAEGVEVDSLNGGDRIVAVANGFGKLTHVFVMARQADVDIYFNVNRMFDEVAGTTTRTPNEQGEYEFLFLHNGELVTLKTKNREVATMIDSLIPSFMVLSQDSAGYITGAMWGPHAAGGLSAEFAGWYDVTDINGKNVTAEKLLPAWDTGTIAKGVMSSACKVYDISETAEVYGQETELRVGDRIYGMTNASGQVCLIYVIRREVDSQVYWNVYRQFDKKTGQTARKPDKDGYYRFVLAVDGTQVEVKTKDKDIANRIDADAKQLFGLKLNGEEIERVYSFDSVTGGWMVADGFEITRKVGDVLMVKDMIVAGAQEATYNINPECKFYNVTAPGKTCGEETTIKAGDRVRILTNPRGEVIGVYVLFVQNHIADTHYCQHCKKKVSWIGWDGVSHLEKSGHYYLMQDVSEATQNTIGTDEKKDIDVVLCLNGHTISSEERAFLVRGTLTVTDHENAGGMICGRGHPQDGNAGVFLVGSGGTVNVYSGTLKLSEDQNTVTYGGVFEVAKDCKLNVYGGTIIGGKAQTGGAVQLWGGTMTMSGGTITGGSATYGGNVYVETGAKFIMTGGTIEGGTAKEGGNVLIGYQAEMELKDGTIADGKALRVDAGDGTENFDGGHGGNLMCAGTVTMTGGSLRNGYANGVGGGNVSLTGDKALMTMTGGTLEKGKAVEQGGGGNVLLFNSTSQFCLKGGTVTGGYADKIRHGGNILVVDDSTLTIEGGLIENGQTAGSGGNIFAFGTVNMYGGTVTGGLSQYGEENLLLYLNKNNPKQFTMTGGTIAGSLVVANYTDTDKTISISGTAVVDGSPTGKNLVLPENVKLQLGDGLQEGAKVGVTASGYFTTAAAKENIVYFRSDVNNAQVNWTDKGLVLGVVHCVCGGSLAQDSNHTCSDTVWTVWDSATELPTQAGNYLLTKDVQLQWQHRFQQNINLCLNGHTITRKQGERVMTVSGGATVNICDCSANSSGKIAAAQTNNGEQGVCIWIHEKSTLNLYGGTVDGSKVSTTNTGAAVCVDYGEGNTFHMYGGKIVGGAAESGGAVAVMDNAEFVLYGGIITGGSASYGGNVYATGMFAMEGGQIEKGVAHKNGGNIALVGKEAYTVSGGVICYGSAVDGGNIALADPDANLTVSDHTAISFGSATGNGGNICSYGALTVSGQVKLTNDEAHKTGGGGGNIFGGGPVTLTENVQVSGGCSADAGGNILMDYDKLLTVRDNAVIRDGRTDDSGGNIRGSLNMSGGTVTGGYAALNSASANVHIHDRSLTMSGGKVEGYLWISGQSKATLSGRAEITGGETNLWLHDGVLVKVSENFSGRVGVTLGNGEGAFTQPDCAKSLLRFFSDSGRDIGAAEDGSLVVGLFSGGMENGGTGTGGDTEFGEIT